MTALRRLRPSAAQDFGNFERQLLDTAKGEEVKPSTENLPADGSREGGTWTVEFVGRSQREDRRTKIPASGPAAALERQMCRPVQLGGRRA